MSYIRILVNFDTMMDNYKNYLTDERFNIDTRWITSIGDENSADTLTEYDAIILSFENPINFIPDRLRQLLNYLKQENKLFVFILRKHNEQSSYSNTMMLGAVLEQLGISSAGFIRITPSGSQFTVTEQAKKNIFFNYLKVNNGKWKISFNDLNNNSVIPLAINTDNNFVSFSLNNDNIQAYNAFVPWLTDCEEVFWNTIKYYLLNKNKNVKEVADWVKAYQFPQMADVTKDIEEKQTEINTLELEREELEKQIEHYERIRNTLLYHDGDLLKDVCKEVLQFLGLKIEEGKIGREDLFFVYNNDHYLFEVKGCEKSASKEHIKQVNSHVTEYSDEKEVKVKGILLINAWRKLALEERDTPDHPIFPAEIMKLVKLYNICLITTQQLFVMYCKKLDNKYDLEGLIKEINCATYQLQGFADLTEYKIL